MGMKDNLLYTHIAIAYDFNAEKKDPPLEPLMDEVMNLLLQDTIDSDGDNVVDHVNVCAKTPPNTQVDALVVRLTMIEMEFLIHLTKSYLHIKMSSLLKMELLWRLTIFFSL